MDACKKSINAWKLSKSNDQWVPTNLLSAAESYNYTKITKCCYEAFCRFGKPTSTTFLESALTEWRTILRYIAAEHCLKNVVCSIKKKWSQRLIKPLYCVPQYIHALVDMQGNCYITGQATLTWFCAWQYRALFQVVPANYKGIFILNLKCLAAGCRTLVRSGIGY